MKKTIFDLYDGDILTKNGISDRRIDKDTRAGLSLAKILRSDIPEFKDAKKLLDIVIGEWVALANHEDTWADYHVDNKEKYYSDCYQLFFGYSNDNTLLNKNNKPMPKRGFSLSDLKVVFRNIRTVEERVKEDSEILLKYTTIFSEGFGFDKISDLLGLIFKECFEAYTMRLVGKIVEWNTTEVWLIPDEFLISYEETTGFESWITSNKFRFETSNEINGKLKVEMKRVLKKDLRAKKGTAALELLLENNIDIRETIVNAIMKEYETKNTSIDIQAHNFVKELKLSSGKIVDIKSLIKKAEDTLEQNNSIHTIILNANKTKICERSMNTLMITVLDALTDDETTVRPTNVDIEIWNEEIGHILIEAKPADNPAWDDVYNDQVMRYAKQLKNKCKTYQLLYFSMRTSREYIEDQLKKEIPQTPILHMSVWTTSPSKS